MKHWFFLFLLFFFEVCTVSGQYQPTMHCENSAFDQEVRNWLSFSVPLMSVDELHSAREDSILLLDARETEEYTVSHIPGAVWIGYNKWDRDVLQKIPKNQPIVVYCSIGYRSEKIAEKIRKMGYSQVKNLYGSIFEWVNHGYPVQDKNQNPTHTVHGFNEKWSKWILNPDITKIW